MEYITTIKNSSAYLQSILTEVLDMQKTGQRDGKTAE
jgi:hypothetical protein